MYSCKHFLFILNICGFHILIRAEHAAETQSVPSVCDLVYNQFETLKQRLVEEFPVDVTTENNSEELIQTNSTENKLFFMRDIDEKGNPKICRRTGDTRITCYDITLPTSCIKPSPKACWDSKCYIHNSLSSIREFWVPCNNTIDGGGWTVVQRRISQNSFIPNNWITYKNGFGQLDGDFWIGLDKLYALTNQLAPVELYIQIVPHIGTEIYAKYDNFSVGGEEQKYFLKSLGTYSGSAGDYLSYDLNMKFSTEDRDNDYSTDINCAEQNTGGWWYNDCGTSNLNAQNIGRSRKQRIIWGTSGSYYGYRFLQMLIRPKKN